MCFTWRSCDLCIHPIAHLHSVPAASLFPCVQGSCTVAECKLVINGIRWFRWSFWLWYLTVILEAISGLKGANFHYKSRILGTIPGGDVNLDGCVGYECCFLGKGLCWLSTLPVMVFPQSSGVRCVFGQMFVEFSMLDFRLGGFIYHSSVSVL